MFGPRGHGASHHGDPGTCQNVSLGCVRGRVHMLAGLAVSAMVCMNVMCDAVVGQRIRACEAECQHAERNCHHTSAAPPDQVSTPWCT